MIEDPNLIPPPPLVRERLSRNYREARLLRSLLRLAIRADEERREHWRIFGAAKAPVEPDGREVGHDA